MAPEVLFNKNPISSEVEIELLLEMPGISVKNIILNNHTNIIYLISFSAAEEYLTGPL